MTDDTLSLSVRYFYYTKYLVHRTQFGRNISSAACSLPATVVDAIVDRDVYRFILEHVDSTVQHRGLPVPQVHHGVVLLLQYNYI